MRKQFFFALALLLTVTMQAQTYWNGTSNKVFNGSGTQADPYLISTPEQLAGLAELCNDRDNPNEFAGKYFKLTADIYLTDFNNPDTASWPQWEPIGHYVRQGFDNGFAYSRYFRGHFDGDGHTIYNMYFKGDVDWGGDINLDAHDWENNNMEDLENLTWDSWYRGLFCFLEGTAENVTVANARMSGLYIAPLARQVGENAVVRNCHVVNPYMYATQGNNSGFVQDNYGLIENSSVQVNLFGRRNSYGLVGTNHESGIIRDCQANVTSDSYFCSPIAYINQGIIERTHTTVDITADHASMASGFVYSNQKEGVIRECSSSGTVRGLGNAPRTAQWSGQIAGFCIINTGLIESSWSTCNMVRNDAEYNYDMAGFVLANGYNGSGVQYDGIPGNAINCFTAGTLTFSSGDITSGLHPFLQQYNGTSGTPSTPYYSPSRQFNCCWAKEGIPQVTNLSHYWAGEEMTLAQMQSQAFVDTLNMIARFMGTSQWEYRPGQLPRPTSVYIHDKTDFFAQGSGTADDPYLVSNKTELEHLAWLVNRGYDFRNEYIKQTADIELNAPESEWGEVAPTKWTTIGKTRTSPYFSVPYPVYFDGSYDGDFHEVKNMYINDPSGTQGLFGNVGSSHGGGGEYGMPQEQYYIRPAVIRNLGVTGVYIRATKAGAVVGSFGTSADLIQCWSSGKIYAASASSQIAGLIGTVYMYSRILNNKTSVALYPVNSSGEVRSFSGEVGGSLNDSLVNALYIGAYQSDQQRESLFAFSGFSGEFKNVYRDSTLSPQNAGWNGTYLYSTQQMQSKELVNELNTTVTEWNTTHRADKQLDYWKWRENDYPHISRDTVGLFYKVTFETNEGSSILPMYVVPGSQITAPMRPTKSGYLFHAWYRDEALTDFFDFKRDSVTSNMTLYAKWMVDARGDYDLTPFQNEFATTYHISTAAQLRGLAVAQMGTYDWTNYNIATNEGTKTTVTAPMDFTGKTIVLDNDIFLNDTADWKLWGNHCYAVPWTPIGQNIPQSGMDISFKGTFDGQGHVVYGLYCEMGTTVAGYTDRYDSQFGLFACLNGGTVRNVGVEASVIDLRKHDDAPLPYEAAGSVSTQKGISIYGNRAGMLIGKLHTGTVEQCFAKGRIIPHEKDPMYADISDSYLGGLISSVEGTIGDRTSGSVSNCYAQVDIIREQYDDIKGYAIIGSGVSKNDHYCEVTFANCYGAGICSQGNNIATTYYNKDLVVKPAANTQTLNTAEMKAKKYYVGWDFDTVWGRNDTVNNGYPFLRVFHPNTPDTEEPEIIRATSMKLQTATTVIMQGDSLQIEAIFTPENTSNQKVLWVSSKPGIASVDQNGLVRAVSSQVDPVVITATSYDGNFVKRCTLNIKQPVVSFYSTALKSRRIGDTEWITGKDANTNYTLNWEYLIAAYVTPEQAKTPFTWESNNTDLLTIEPFAEDTTVSVYVYGVGTSIYNGSCAIMRCVGEGSDTIIVTGTKYGKTRKQKFKVQRYDATEIAISGSATRTMKVGEIVTLSVTTTPAATSYVPEISWSSDAPDIVSVDETGTMEALSAGTAVVTATCGTMTASVTITVSAVQPTGVTLDITTATLYEGETLQLTATVQPANATDKTITWTSNAPDYASVDQNGLVTAIKARSTRVSIEANTSNNYNARCRVTVMSLTGMSLNETNAMLELDETLQLTASFTPAEAQPHVVWTSADESVVTVTEDGLVTAVGYGNAAITATAGSLSTTCTIVVPCPDCPCDPVVCDFTTQANGHSNYNDKWTYDEMWDVFGGANNNNGWNYVKMGGKSATLSSANPVYVVNKMPLECEIKAVKVTFPAGSLGKSGMSCNNWGVKVYSDLACSNLLYTVNGGTISGSAEELTIVAQEGQPWSAGYAIQVYWDLANTTTSNGIVFVSKIEYLTEAPAIPEPTYYTIRFLNYDGMELQNNQVLEGDIPVYTGTTPIRLEDANYTYAFSGWSPAIVAATADADYTATFTATEKVVIPDTTYYTVRFLNYDGTELQSLQVIEDSLPVYTGAIPTRAEDDTYTYEFSGWTPAIVPATADVDYTATFTATEKIHEPIYYTIRFLNYDGTELQNSQVREGGMPLYKGATPTKPEDDTYTYAFKGWSPTIVPATADADYTATFTATPKPIDASPKDLTIVSQTEKNNVTTVAFRWSVVQQAAMYELIVKEGSNYIVNTNVGSLNMYTATFSKNNLSIGTHTLSWAVRSIGNDYAPISNYVYGPTFTVTIANEEGLDDIDASSAPRKILIDGVIYILRGDKIYTTSGQEVK